MSRPFSINTTRTTYNQDGTWSGPVLLPFYHPSLSLGQLIVNRLSARPFNIGQLCHEDGHEMRNHEILQNSVRVCLHLKDLGLKEGEIIGVACGNSRYLSQVIFGAVLSGNPINAVDPSFECSDISHFFAKTTPKLVFCDQENYGQVQLALSQLKNPSEVIVCDNWDENDSKSVLKLLKHHPGELEFVPPTLKDPANSPAMIICSSGSTGVSKAIAFSHATLNYYGQISVSTSPSDTIFSFSSYYWLGGLSALLLTTLNSIKRVIVQKPFSAALLLEIIKERQVTFLMCPPIFCQLLHQEGFQESDLKSLKVISCAGWAVAPTLREQFKVPIVNSYGLTETMGISVNGQLSSGVTVKIVDENGVSLGVGKPGEICVKSSYMFLGYYGDPEATKEHLKEDGFFHTDDMGMFDESGNLHIVDRKKEIFKGTFGFHVNPSDVESVLQRLPGIGTVCVVGIPHPILQNLPAVLIVPQPGSTITEKSVHEFAQNNLPKYKLLTGGVYFVNELPMTASGKIKRRLVAKIAAALFDKNEGIVYDYGI